MSDELNWRDTSLGTRVRVALWLQDTVPEGAIFSRQELRDAIQGAEQVDRRMRDLRPAGWEIKTYRDKPSLQPDQLYLEKIGLPIWEKKYRAAGLRTISAETRRLVYGRDGHLCRQCGVGAAESYPGEPDSRARLTLGQRNSHKPVGAVSADDLITECARCRGAARSGSAAQASQGVVWSLVRELSVDCQKDLLAWMVDDARPLRSVELAWGAYRQLPPAARNAVLSELSRLLER